jgi:hypothetical protein
MAFLRRFFDFKLMKNTRVLLPITHSRNQFLRAKTEYQAKFFRRKTLAFHLEPITHYPF